MCGTYGLNIGDEKARTFDGYYGTQNAEMKYEIRTRYNIKPKQRSIVVFQDETGARQARDMRWGLVPAWSKEPDTKFATFNARSESVSSKSMFKSAFKNRRSLIPASYFIEWNRKADDPKQPHLIKLKSGDWMSFAGLYEEWKDPNNENNSLLTFTILTTEPNEFMSSLHHRMPVILAAEDFDLWLDSSISDYEALDHLFQPCPNEWLASYPVSKRFNSYKNNDADMLEKIELGPTQKQTGLAAFGVE